ncbi:uncharacterized protein [Montipora foliosa]|uniref:uncharacterized protein isoform X7 n=1 Tax=Montipora foliosa TaxID=591990 RepID=UPI0035F20E66
MSKIDGNGSPASAEWLHIGTKCCCEFAYVGSSFAVSARNLTLKNSASLVFHWPTDGTPKHGSLFSSSGLHKARPSLGEIKRLLGQHSPGLLLKICDNFEAEQVRILEFPYTIEERLQSYV